MLVLPLCVSPAAVGCYKSEIAIRLGICSITAGSCLSAAIIEWHASIQQVVGDRVLMCARAVSHDYAFTPVPSLIVALQYSYQLWPMSQIMAAVHNKASLACKQLESCLSAEAILCWPYD